VKASRLVETLPTAGFVRVSGSEGASLYQPKISQGTGVLRIEGGDRGTWELRGVPRLLRLQLRSLSRFEPSSRLAVNP